MNPVEKKELKNKPLLEAIFEIKWKLQQTENNLLYDPYYEILLGRLQERVQGDFPFPEPLHPGMFFTNSPVLYRFRKAANDWPLIQIGPGVLSINETTKYKWEDFKLTIEKVMKSFFEAHPKPDDLEVEHVLLRYVDGYDIKYTEKNILDFLKDKMKIDIDLPDRLYGQGLKQIPQYLKLEISLPCESPIGIAILRFNTGHKFGNEAFIWETLIKSIEKAAPTDVDSIISWLDSAHEITRWCFDTLIEGELEKEFE